MTTEPFALHLGDCREVLKTIADNSVDSIVTDPPYELGFMGKDWDASGIAYDRSVWSQCLRVLKPGGHLLAFSGSRTYHRMVCAIEDAGFEVRDQIMWLYGSGFPKSRNLDDDWKGWGTALKPAHEPICVARKPLAGTVGQNVMAHGTGALNIDACRVATDEVLRVGSGGIPCRHDAAGRWPANVIHDGSDEVLSAFPFTQSGTPSGTKAGGQGNAFGHFNGGVPVTGYGDAGTAARFFYCAKADRADRNEGTEALPQRLGGMVSNTSGQHITRRDGEYQAKPQGNYHPTVKPTELMAYLCRLVTPPGGVVLDPFTGSGSTGKAAMREGFRFIGIELSPQYIDIARARISFEAARVAELAAEAARQPSLFGEAA